MTQCIRSDALKKSLELIMLIQINLIYVYILREKSYAQAKIYEVHSVSLEIWCVWTVAY